MRPGITVRPERSTVSAPAGTRISAARPMLSDAVPFDDDAAALDRRCATAVDDADVVEYDAAHLHRLRGRDRQCVRDDCGANHPSKRSAHVWQARHSTSDTAWQHGIADRNRQSRRYAEYSAVAATIL